MDGQWYNIEKIKTKLKVNNEQINSVLNYYKEYIDTLKDSYRIKDAEIILQWHKKHDIKFGTTLLPNNFPPRIYNNKTEVQCLLDVKKEWNDIVRIYGNNEDLQDARLLLRKFWGTRVSSAGLDVYALSFDIVKNYLETNLADEVFNRLRLSNLTFRLNRDLDLLDKTFFNESFKFYKPYIKTILKNYISTLSMFLNDEEDYDSQVAEWYMRTLSVFDETQPVPLTAYIAVSARNWPFELSEEVLGIELAKFQRKKRAIENKYSDQKLSEQEIADLMNINVNKYRDLSSTYNNWLSDRMTAVDISELDSGIKGPKADQTNTLYKENKNSDLSVLLTKACIKSLKDADNKEDFLSFLNSYTLGKTIKNCKSANILKKNLLKLQENNLRGFISEIK